MFDIWFFIVGCVMFDLFLFPWPAYLQVKFSYLPQTAIYGWIKVGSQGENSKSQVWAETKPEIILIIL